MKKHNLLLNTGIMADSNDNSASNSNHIQSEENMTEKLQYISSKQDLSKIQLMRHKLEEWINDPNYENAINKCFVRIGIGTNNHGQPVYRIAQVTGVVETDEIYVSEYTRTNKALKLKHGNQEKIFSLDFVSNQEFTDKEFYKWKETVLLEGLSLPTTIDISTKVKDLEDALNYENKGKEVDAIVKED